LEGPVGNKYIGAEYYAGYARENVLEATTDEDAGLLPTFDAPAGGRFDTYLVRSEVRGF
jgi:hypothetical protein